MTVTIDALRANAVDCLARARQAGPMRAAELRTCAKEYLKQARETALFEHGKAIGFGNVTAASFREYFRNART